MVRDQSSGPVSLSVQSAEQNCLKRGNLRFFLGGSGGMTAMRVMLETAVAAKKTGADIVVGLVSSSGCDPLDRLLRCFDHLPGSGRPLSKKHEANAIDLNAVRKRIPGILLVDMRPSPKCDAARVPGSARPDDSLAAIEDVIASGIDVWAAVDATGLSSWASVGVGVPRQISGVSLL